MPRKSCVGSRLQNFGEGMSRATGLCHSALALALPLDAFKDGLPGIETSKTMKSSCNLIPWLFNMHRLTAIEWQLYARRVSAAIVLGSSSIQDPASVARGSAVPWAEMRQVCCACTRLFAQSEKPATQIQIDRNSPDAGKET